MQIRYGVYRNGKGINGTVDIPVDYKHPDYHKEAVKAIMTKHPGYNIHGFGVFDDAPGNAQQQVQADEPSEYPDGYGSHGDIGD